MWSSLRSAVCRGDASETTRILDTNMFPEMRETATLVSIAARNEDVAVLKAFIEPATPAQRSRMCLSMLLDTCLGRYKSVLYLYSKGVRANFKDHVNNLLVCRNFDILEFLENEGEIVSGTEEMNEKYPYLCPREYSNYLEYRRAAVQKRVDAVNKIGRWWIPICYTLVDTPDGKTRRRMPCETNVDGTPVVTRMMEKAWARMNADE